MNGTDLPSSFPYVPYDARELVAFLGDPVLGAAYPAEFIGASGAQNDLNAVSSVSAINQLLTFSGATVDMVSIGGVIQAQAGSSGGPVVNAWQKLIGLITTTSAGKTTADRTLRAISLSYVNRDMQVQTGADLRAFLASDLDTIEDEFNAVWLNHLTRLYIDQISK